MWTGKLRRYVLLNLPYAFVFWVCLKLGTAYRLADGADMGHKLIHIVKTIGPAFRSFAPGLNSQDWLVGLIGAIIIRLVVYVKSKNAKKFRKDVEYGSARWGTAKDIKPFVDPVFRNNVILTGTEYLTINTRPKNPANARNLNACVIGSSGSGKTRFWLTPQLLQAHSSYVVVDPKGSILGQVGHFLQKQGYRIKVFNSVDFAKSMHYNPIAYLKTESDILKFINALITNTKGDGKEGDEFWTKAETLLYCALVAYIVFEGKPEDKNINTLVDMINSMETREDDDNFKNAVDYMMAGLEKRKPNHFAVRQYKKYKLASGKTAMSILISMAVRLSAFNLPRLASLTSHDELDLASLGEKKTALFAVLPDNDSSFNFLIGMLYTQLFQQLFQLADFKYRGRLPVHVHFLMDEFANVALPDEFDKLLSTMRSREVSVSIILQNLAQLKALFEKQWESIVGNADELVYLGGNEQSTHEYISKLLGKETINLDTYGQSKGRNGSYSTNIQMTGRELMTPDEVRMLDNRYALLFIRGEYAVKDEKYDILKHPNVALTVDGGAPPYLHGQAPKAIETESILLPGEYADYEILSETELQERYELEEHQK